MISVRKAKGASLWVTSPIENTNTKETIQTMNQANCKIKPTIGKKKMQQFDIVKLTVVLKTAIPS